MQNAVLVWGVPKDRFSIAESGKTNYLLNNTFCKCYNESGVYGWKVATLNGWNAYEKVNTGDNNEILCSIDLWKDALIKNDINHNLFGFILVWED